MKTIVKPLKWIALILAGCFVAICLYIAPYLLLMPGPPQLPAQISSMDDLDQYFSSMVAEEFPPAMDVTVIQGGQVIFAKAYGIANGVTREVATSGHVYHFWSITKTFTAVAILQLVESGKVSVDEPITTYLPQFDPMDQSGNRVEITVGNLLNHSSGLSDFTSKLFLWVHDIDAPPFGETRMVNERLGDYRTVSYRPGSESNYKNINYVILGAIIESVTDGSYEDYIRENIIKPLQMEQTDFIYRPDMLKKAALGTLTHYSYYTPVIRLLDPRNGIDGFTQQRIDDVHWLKPVYTDYAASSALIGTGIDLGRFGQMLLNAGELDGIRILSRESTAEILHGGRIANNESDITLGNGTMRLISHGTELIGHGGGGPGFALQYLLAPDKDLVIVVLTNGTIVDVFELSLLIASIF